MTSRFTRWALAATCVVSRASIAGTAWAQATVITARRDGFKAMGANMDAIKLVVDARGDARPLAPRVDEVVAYIGSIPGRFPEASATGDTRALPAIWTNRADFDRVAANALTAAQTLRTAVNTNDPAATAAAFQALGGACGACHRPYRAR